ncbi:MAG: carboxypeptidase-like regulatory domain-containing protein [Rhodobacteraceae bacterium]|nr:carboxypeptidase-like regulatory domain-containing protein [Paracoccaceae bacterium]
MFKTAALICSPMTGVITEPGGGPAAGAVVCRSWSWRGKSGSDEALTDANGRFSFDGVPARRGFLALLPLEDAITQEYSATYNGEEYEILFATPRGFGPGHATNGAPFDLTCALGQESGHGNFLWGNCRLNG